MSIRPQFLAQIPNSLIAERQENPLWNGTADPKVSVIICTFNRAHLLPYALQSVFAQNIPPADYEVILVDDGSQDGTREVALQHQGSAPCPMVYIHLAKNSGLSTGRNVALGIARGEITAHTDDDCVATTKWLESGLQAFNDSSVGAVQGATLPNPVQPKPFFNHYIHCESFDGSFSGCNVFYRRRAALQAGGFDPDCDYWEDVDFGWRVCRNGWAARFVKAAVVFHQVVPLSPKGWLLWPSHFRSMPAKASRYPEFRRFLFLGIWVGNQHAAFDLALLGAGLATLFHPAGALLALPYVILFLTNRGLKGRWPPAKALLHLAWDFHAFVVLVTNSVRYRSLVL